MKHVTAFLFLLYCAAAHSQWYFYQPAVKSAKEQNWTALERQMDSIETAFPDSVTVPMTLYFIGNELHEQKALQQLKPYAYHMIAYESRRNTTRFPVTTDQKMDWARREEASKLCAKGHYYLSELYFAEQQYDSCLAHVDRAMHGWNYSGMHYFTWLYELAMELRYMKSVCLERAGRDEEARTVLVPFLLLDGVYSEDAPYTHKDVVQQYVHLLEKAQLRVLAKAALSEAIEHLAAESQLPEDTVRLLTERYGYYGEVYYMQIEGKYVPVVMDRQYWIDHPYDNDKKPEIHPSTETGHRQLVEKSQQVPDPKRIAYVKGYLEHTLLYRSL